MDDEQGHEEGQPRKIRVVDRRISSRRAHPSGGGEASPSPAGAASTSPSEPIEDPPSAPAGPEAAAGEPATVTPLRPSPPKQSDNPSTAVASDNAAAPPQPPRASEAPGQGVWTPEQEEEARRMSEEMARIPSVEWVINVAVTLANAAGTKLNEGLRDDAGLAIDALAAIVEKVGPKLGEAEAPLRQTLAQLQMAYAQVAGGPEGPPS